MKKLLMGNEAIGFAAIYSGVNVVTGYPGTPSTEVLETIAKNNPGDIYIEWSTNEKVALEVGAGSAYSGARVLVTMKQVGLNVAADPLMSLSYIGVKGGMVILVADDPGPISSQTEQDTRHFAKFSNLPVFDPSTPEEAFEMTIKAFELSEKINLPVFLRPTTRICHSCSTIEIPEKRQKTNPEGFIKDSKWVIFPKLAFKNHKLLEQKQKEIGSIFSHNEFNSFFRGKEKKGIAASGISYAYVKEYISQNNIEINILKVGNTYPFPEELGMDFLSSCDEVLVLEELDPVIEEALVEIAYYKSISVKIFGKKTNHMPNAGEYSFELIKASIERFTGIEDKKTRTSFKDNNIPEFPIRPPVLCAGCPHRASFFNVKKALKGKKAIFTGDIGCYTLGNASPLEMVDTCLCMGADITVAQGIKRVDKDAKLISFIGDSTFFHTGIPGLINAVYNGTDITMVVLDNSTTAMTGHQPHPGTGNTMMGTNNEKLSIESVAKGCGIRFIVKADPLDVDASIDAINKAVEFEGPSMIIFESPCVAIIKTTKIMKIDSTRCINCGKCIRELGCPAIFRNDNRVWIEESLCRGCELCKYVCPAGAIGGVE